MKPDLFQSCGHCWVFQICWHTECSTFTASFFRIWNSSTGIPSPPLAFLLFLLCTIVEDVTCELWNSGKKNLCRSCYSEGEVIFLSFIILLRFCLRCLCRIRKMPCRMSLATHSLTNVCILSSCSLNVQQPRKKCCGCCWLNCRQVQEKVSEEV